MSAVAFLEAARKEVHDRVLRDVADLTHEQLLWRPGPELTNIAYLLWHLVRIEDLSIQRQFTKFPPIYKVDGWADRLGLDPELRPAGLTPEQLDTVGYRLEDFLPYARNVWDRTSEVLKDMQDEDLERPAKVADLPEVTTVGALLRTVLISHPWRHLGEILYLRQLQGWRYHTVNQPRARKVGPASG